MGVVAFWELMTVWREEMLRSEHVKRDLKCVLVLVVVLAFALFFNACGQEKNTDGKAKVISTVPDNCRLVIKESGWSYSETDGCTYYGMVIKNKSRDFMCIGAAVEIIQKDKAGNELKTETYSIPVVAPDGNIEFGVAGEFSDFEPKEVEFKIASDCTWAEIDEDDSIGTEKPLKVSGVKAKEYDGGSDSGMGGVDEDLEKIEKELKVSGGDSASETDDLTAMEYKGKIVNKNEYEISEVLLCIIYRNDAGKIAGGENMTVRDVRSSGKTSFSFVSSCDVSTDKYGLHAYSW